MKLKSLILGSVAAAGLSTAGYAADLGVMTSLDVCDALGLSGLTISSDTNCLQITGGVSYTFEYGDYRGDFVVTDTLAGTQDIDNNNSGPFNPDDMADPTDVVDADDEIDWESQVEAWLQFVGTADSDFGPARAVIRIQSIDELRVQNEHYMTDDDDTDGFEIDEAYVSVGDSTVIMAGKKGSIANFGDDEPFNFLGLFNSSEVDTGVAHDIGIEDFYTEQFDTGGHSIQVVSDLGNGLNVGVGLENLAEDEPGEENMAGTLVGVVGYAGEGITAHVTGLVGGILDGDVDAYAVHAGATGTFDMFRIRGAIAANHYVPTDETFWNGLASAAATFDLFTLAVSGEANGGTNLDTDYGFGGSVGANVTEGVAINLGGRYYENNNGGDDGYQVAAQLVAAVTETISLTGEVGMYGNTTADTSDFYGAAEMAWAPGGGFTSALGGEVHENGAYKVTFEAAKEFN